MWRLALVSLLLAGMCPVGREAKSIGGLKGGIIEVSPIFGGEGTESQAKTANDGANDGSEGKTDPRKLLQLLSFLRNKGMNVVFYIKLRKLFSFFSLLHANFFYP